MAKKVKGWVKVGGEFAPMFEFVKIGTTLEGIFKGSKTIESGKGKKARTQSVHTIKTSKDEVQIWGSGLLDFLLAQVKVGSMIRIVYKGKKKIKKSKNLCHQFEVYQRD